MEWIVSPWMFSLDSPKSVIRMCPSRSSSRFSGFRSLLGVEEEGHTDTRYCSCVDTRVREQFQQRKNMRVSNGEKWMQGAPQKNGLKRGSEIALPR